MTLFPELAAEMVVNVASVPHRSPFRYAGGKTWLVPRMRQWLAGLPMRPRQMIEPFAGGASVGLAALFEGYVDRLILVERDEQVASVWQAVLSSDVTDLINRIRTADLGEETVRQTLAEEPGGLQDRAFQTILRNRVNRGGILAPGTGILKAGENGKGLLSRWYPETLVKRIEAIHAQRRSICFQQGDGIAALQEYESCIDSAFFIAPPYTVGGKRAGSRLYKHSVVDHTALFAAADALAGPFWMTYDDAEEVRILAAQHNFATQPVAMKNTHHARMTELIVTRSRQHIR